MKTRTFTALACAAAVLSSTAFAGDRLDAIVKNNTLRVGTPATTGLSP